MDNMSVESGKNFFLLWVLDIKKCITLKACLQNTSFVRKHKTLQTLQTSNSSNSLVI